MGNPIYRPSNAPVNKKHRMPVSNMRNHGFFILMQEQDQVDAEMNTNGHPIREFVNRDWMPPRLTNHDPVQDLEEMIIQQLRPRSFSVLFGSEAERNNAVGLMGQDQGGDMEQIMGQLRRQLRNSSVRMAQDSQLVHRNSSNNRDARDRLENERLVRRIRSDRNHDPSLFQSAFQRWNLARNEREAHLEARSQRLAEHTQGRTLSIQPRIQVFPNSRINMPESGTLNNNTSSNRHHTHRRPSDSRQQR